MGGIMKNMDSRSLMVGLLTGVCVFLMMGQNRGNMGDIVVNSITVKDDGNGGFIRTYNTSGVLTTYIGTGENEGGFLRTQNKDGIETSYLGTSSEHFGFLSTSNGYGKQTTYIGTNINNDGMVVLNDRYGEVQWGEVGSK